MISHQNSFGQFQPGNPSACGNVASVTLSPFDQFSIKVTWEPTHDVLQDTVFAVYLNGRLAQVHPRVIRATTILSPNADTQEIEVIAWPSAHAVPDTLYLSTTTRRAHLEWNPVTASDLTGYNIYHGTSPLPTDLYGTQTNIAVNGTAFDFTSGATCLISGTPSNPAYHNCTFTVTVDGDNTIIVSNSVDAVTDTTIFLIGQPVNVFDGITIVITEQPVDEDELDFDVRIQTYYDTRPLAPGTHYFNVTAVDSSGNESTPTADAVIAITPLPPPVESFSLDIALDKLVAHVTQSGVGDGVRIYSNYDASTQTLRQEVIYSTVFLEQSLDSEDGATFDLFADINAVPAGLYKFVCRSMAGGIESDDTTNDQIELPYYPNEPEIITATIDQIGSNYLLTVYATGIPTDDKWLVSYTPNDDSYEFPAVPTATSDDLYLKFEHTATDPVGGQYTFTISAGTNGKPFTFNFTFDDVAPSTPTGFIGVPY